VPVREVHQERQGRQGLSSSLLDADIMGGCGFSVARPCSFQRARRPLFLFDYLMFEVWYQPLRLFDIADFVSVIAIFTNVSFLQGMV
jgi:hypothetical protein